MAPILPPPGLLSAQDLAEIERQIGRRPQAACRVETRCPNGHPQVVQSYPIVAEAQGWKPFPTLFWLTCPELRVRIARLERDGGVRSLALAVRADPDLQAGLERDHRAYAAERWALLSEAERELAGRLGVAQVLRDSGIGGVRRPHTLKCLHLHAAHHLARGSTVGRLLEAATSLAGCPPGGLG